MRHGRPVLAVALLAIGLAWNGFAGRVPAEPTHIADELLHDADLADIFFLDPDRGWAVGDRGVIWHTEDGGRHWRLQSSPVACRLESVFFLNDQLGWTVGGWIQPYTHHTTGVVLVTTDGGQSWHRMPHLSMPTLKKIRFFDARNGWALGNSSATYPAGVFQTNDGGRSWASIPCRSKQNWMTGDFQERGGAVLGGADGAVAFTASSGVELAEKPATGMRHVRCVRLPHADGSAGTVRGERVPGWLVGDGGLVLSSNDGGRTWQTPPGPLPHGMYDYFDFHGVANLGQRCWIVGAPGTTVLHSKDGGQSWQKFPTGQDLPLRTVTFLDEYRGWAAGALGVILATRDGGQTWFVQRQGGSRAALLALFSSPGELPMELIAQQAGNEGYLCAVELITRPDPIVERMRPSTIAARSREALSTVGASATGFAWGFPVPEAVDGITAEGLLDSWSRLHQTDASQLLEEYLVRTIRQWRPSVVVTEPASPRRVHPLAHLVNQAVLRAVEQAADETAFIDHLSLAGLEPWQVQRVYSYAGPDEAGSLNITTAQIAPRLGRSLSDQADLAWRLLRDAPQPPAETLGFRLVTSHTGQHSSRQSPFAGIDIAPGSESRRMLHDAIPSALQSYTRMAQQRHVVNNLLRQISSTTHDTRLWVGQVDSLIRDFDASSAGDALYQLSNSLMAKGQSKQAAAVLELLTRRYPQHDLTPPALIWLLQYHASSEVAWQQKRTSVAESPSADPSAESQSPVQPAAFFSPTGSDATAKPHIRVQGSTARIDQDHVDFPRLAASYAQRIHGACPALYSEPEVRFPSAANQRENGLAAEADRYYSALAGSRVQDDWWWCARSEFWLQQPIRGPLKPVVHCKPTDEKPHLDGLLNDAAWQTAAQITLRNPLDPDVWPATAMVAYDHEFLYLAINCIKADGRDYADDGATRQRDTSLEGHDRVRILLDRDRDYTTAYQLTVDHRGWGNDALISPAAWDPEWFIAILSDGPSWTIEAAIPWEELAEEAPVPGEAWALSLSRLIPGAESQSWCGVSTRDATPGQFGLLLFD